MKKVLISIILILFLTTFVSAINFDMKNTFHEEEILIARLSGDFVDPPLKQNINFYRGHVRIGIDVSLAKIDQDYYWNSFNEFTENVLNNFLSVINFSEETKLELILQYHDFIEFSFIDQDIFKFLNNFLHINLNQTFFSAPNNPKEISLGLSYDTEIGTFITKINKGINPQKKEGIIIQFKVLQNNLNRDLNQILSWINKAHEICSDAFVKMSEGDLYNSFK